MLPRKPPKPFALALEVELHKDTEEIRRHFYELRRAIDPNAVPVASKHLALCSDAAVRASSLGMLPGEYVKACVDQALRNGAPLFPQILVMDLVESPVQATLARARTYKTMLATYADRERIYGPRMTIADDTLGISPLVRFAMATSQRFTDLQDRYRDSARREYDTLSDDLQQLFSEVSRAL